MPTLGECDQAVRQVETAMQNCRDWIRHYEGGGSTEDGGGIEYQRGVMADLERELKVLRYAQSIVAELEGAVRS